MNKLVLFVAIASASCRSGERLLFTGKFHPVAHKGSGEAQVWKRPDGVQYVRLWDLRTYPAPGLEVCLVRANDARNNDAVLQGGVVCLGSLRASGSYPVPPTVDFSRYRAVAVWSPANSVNFTTAPLSPTPSS